METPRRIYFQYQPNDVGRNRLLETQAEAQSAYGGQPIPAAELHLTLLHFGIVDQIFGDVRKVVPGLERRLFNEATQIFISAGSSHMPLAFDVDLYDYRRYGADNSIIVALARKTPELMAAQAALTDELRQFLGRLGIADTDAFISQNKSLWATLDYEPHISLLQQAGFAPELPQLQERLHLQAVPINYDLAHERFT